MYLSLKLKFCQTAFYWIYRCLYSWFNDWTLLKVNNPQTPHQIAF
jgi:hypothetical protein